MEVPSFIMVLAVMWTLPGKLGIESLPRANWLMAVLFVRPNLVHSIAMLSADQLDHSLCE